MTDQEYQQFLINLMLNPPQAEATNYTEILQAQAVLAQRAQHAQAATQHQAERQEQARQEYTLELLEATHGLAAQAALRVQ